MELLEVKSCNIPREEVSKKPYCQNSHIPMDLPKKTKWTGIRSWLWLVTIAYILACTSFASTEAESDLFSLASSKDFKTWQTATMQITSKLISAFGPMAAVLLERYAKIQNALFCMCLLTATCQMLLGILSWCPSGYTVWSLAFIGYELKMFLISAFCSICYAAATVNYKHKPILCVTFLYSVQIVGFLGNLCRNINVYLTGRETLTFLFGGFFILAACVLFRLKSTCRINSEKENRNPSWATLKNTDMMINFVSVGVAGIVEGYLFLVFFSEIHVRFNDNIFIVPQTLMILVGTITWCVVCSKRKSEQGSLVIGYLIEIVSLFLVGPGPFLPYRSSHLFTYIMLIPIGVGFGCFFVCSYSLLLRSAESHGCLVSTTDHCLISSIAFTLKTAGFELGQFVGQAVVNVLGYEDATYRLGLFVAAWGFVLLMRYCNTRRNEAFVKDDRSVRQAVRKNREKY